MADIGTAHAMAADEDREATSHEEVAGPASLDPATPSPLSTEAWQALAVGAVMAAFALLYAFEATKIRVLNGYDAKFTARDYPLLLAGLLLALSLATLANGYRLWRRARRVPPDASVSGALAGQPGLPAGPDAARSAVHRRGPVQLSSDALRALGALALCILYVAAMTPLGFLITTTVFLTGMVLLCRAARPTPRTVVLTVVGSCLGSAAVFALFDTLLGVYLPSGPIALGR